MDDVLSNISATESEEVEVRPCHRAWSEPTSLTNIQGSGKDSNWMNSDGASKRERERHVWGLQSPQTVLREERIWRCRELRVHGRGMQKHVKARCVECRPPGGPLAPLPASRTPTTVQSWLVDKAGCEPVEGWWGRVVCGAGLWQAWTLLYFRVPSLWGSPCSLGMPPTLAPPFPSEDLEYFRPAQFCLQANPASPHSPPLCLALSRMSAYTELLFLQAAHWNSLRSFYKLMLGPHSRPIKPESSKYRGPSCARPGLP